jgi:D-aminopeptidase
VADYDVYTAASAEQALEQLRRIGAVAVIVADSAGRLVAALRAAFDEVSSTRGSDGSGHADVG